MHRRRTERGRERRLPGPGRPVDADQPSADPASGGRPSASSRTASAAVVFPGLTRPVRAPGRSGTVSTMVSPASRCTRLVCSASSPDFACRNHTQSPTWSRRAPGAGQRGLHLARALEPGQVEVRGSPGDRGAVLADRPAGDEAAARHGDQAAARAAYDRDAEEGGRPWVEALVVVEQPRDQQSRAGRDLGDGRVGARSPRRCPSRRRSRTPARPGRPGRGRSRPGAR